MAVVKVLASGWKIEVGDGAATEVFVQVKGLNTLTFGASKTDADGTTFDSLGWTEHSVASRSRTLSAEGFFLEDQATKARDPGQTRIEAVGELIGEDSLANFKLTSPAGSIKTFKGSVNVGDVGGGNEDNTTWGFEITVSGKVTTT